MKLSQILERIPAADGRGYVSFSDISRLFDINAYSPDDSPAWEARIREHYIAPWYCTDQWVGLSVILLDDEPVIVAWQTGRKMDVDYKFVSREAHDKLRMFILSIIVQQEDEIPFVNLDEEMGETYGVAYSEQLLTDNVLFDGKPAVVVTKYRNHADIALWGKALLRLEDGTEQLVEMDKIEIPFVLTP